MQNNKIIKSNKKELFKEEERNIAMRKTSGGARKHNRNKEKCQRYQNQKRKEKNKIRKWRKLIKNLSPNNDMRIQLEKRIKEVER